MSMILYSDKEYSGQFKDRIDDLLGDSLPIKKQIKSGPIGSELYRLRKLKISDKKSDLIDLNSRCNFQKYEKGLLLRINHNMSLYYIALINDSIEDLRIIKGDEIINPFIISLMRLLLIIGVHIRYARYFRLRLSEYSIEPMILKIKSGEDYIELDSHGYNYYNQAKYFKPIIKKLSQ